MPFRDIVELTIAQDALSEVIRTEREAAEAEARTKAGRHG